MNKKTSSLTAKIAQLGVGLVARQHSAEPDIVVERPKHLKPLVKYMGIHLNANELVLLNDLEAWARQNGLRVGRGTLLKAGMRLIQKSEDGLHAIRQVIEGDRRRRIGNLP